VLSTLSPVLIVNARGSPVTGACRTPLIACTMASATCAVSIFLRTPGTLQRQQAGERGARIVVAIQEFDARRRLRVENVHVRELTERRDRPTMVIAVPWCVADEIVADQVWFARTGDDRPVATHSRLTTKEGAFQGGAPAFMPAVRACLGDLGKHHACGEQRTAGGACTEDLAASDAACNGLLRTILGHR